MPVSPLGWTAGLLPVAAVLAVDPGGLSPFGPAKWALVPALVLLGAGGVAAHGGRLAPLPMGLWAAFLAVGVAAAAVGLDPRYAWIGTPERRFGVFTWLLCALAFATGQLLDRGERSAVAAGATVAAGLAGAWAVAERLGWEPVALTGSGSRPVGPLGSSAYLGAAMVLLGPVAIGLAVQHRKVLPVVAAGLSAAALVLSGARAAWAGALVAAVATGVRRRASLRRWATPAAAAAAGIVVLAVLAGVAGRVPDLFDDRQGGAGGRVDEWRVAARVIADHPLTGVGPEGYRIAFGGEVDDAYEERHGRTPLPDRAHSAPLDVAATTGLGGLALYGALLVVVGRVVVRRLGDAEPWVVGVAAGLVAYAAQSLFLFPVAELDPPAWLLAGILVAPAGRGAASRSRRVGAGMLAAVALVTLVAGGLDVVADRRAKSVLQAGAEPDAASSLRPDVLRYHLAEARALERRGSLDGAVAALDDGLHWSPLDPVVRRERARLLLDRARRSGRHDQVEQARQALEDLAGDDPRNAEVLLRLGVARALAGDDDGAEAAWLRAERLAPTSPSASVNLAVAYDQEGRTAEARAAAQRALDRDPTNEQAAALLRG